MAHPCIAEHFENGQRVLGMDRTFMKHGRYKCMMLVAVGRSGSGKNVVLAIGLCDGESERNCGWFWQTARPLVSLWGLSHSFHTAGKV
ncbi:TPA: hypothetical protein N0F65_001147 [Lagenidium giganteum]|uniref:Transposase n=1 Tax=Lagenidium giganteum TaxID=4803 RepID=A0AAV2YVW4_9STRA|nr:TPA: hypothetical protein N0F65_001147 [Lagenidium giganteum]